MTSFNLEQVQPPWYLFNGHLQTIIPSLFRKVDEINYKRERINTQDGDFLDLDWKTQNSSKLVVLTHGLEGNSESQYIYSAVHHYFELGWDVLAWNCRSCSGEMNRKLRLYHHGDVEDIHEVLEHAIATNHYDRVAIVGYSMGGNILLNYLSKRRDEVPSEVKAAFAISPPCKLEVAAKETEMGFKNIYKWKFFRQLKRKIRIKNEQFPGLLNIDFLDKVKSWKEFDENYTIVLNDFPDVETFYYEASSANFIHNIEIPTLIVNAINDPICVPGCNPVEAVAQNDNLILETPSHGGHCGFNSHNLKETWIEERGSVFFDRVMS